MQQSFAGMIALQAKALRTQAAQIAQLQATVAELSSGGMQVTIPTIPEGTGHCSREH